MKELTLQKYFPQIILRMNLKTIVKKKTTTIKQVQPYSITLLGQVKIHTADI